MYFLFIRGAMRKKIWKSKIAQSTFTMKKDINNFTGSFMIMRSDQLN